MSAGFLKKIVLNYFSKLVPQGDLKKKMKKHNIKMTDEEIFQQLKELHKKYPNTFMSPQEYKKSKKGYVKDVMRGRVSCYNANRAQFSDDLKKDKVFMHYTQKVLLSYLSKLIPECSLKKKMGCWYQNYLRNNKFKMYYRNSVFITKLNGVNVKTYENVHFDFEKPYLKEYTIKEGGVVVDAGASNGAFTIYAAKAVGGKGTVITFEPNPKNFEILKKNVELNELKNVILFNKGLWSKNTVLEFNDDGRASSVIFDKKDIKKLIKIQVVKLDDELKRLGVTKVDFFKADIEGAEIEAMKGFKNTLKSNNVNLAIASYHMINGKPSYLLLEDFFNKINYDAYSEGSHTTTYAKKK